MFAQCAEGVQQGVEGPPARTVSSKARSREVHRVLSGIYAVVCHQDAARGLDGRLHLPFLKTRSFDVCVLAVGRIGLLLG